MTAPARPALDAFIAQLGEEGVCVQVSIRRAGDGFELRHADDRDLSPDTLKFLRVEELRALAQSTESGAFRPLKCAPNLRRGWRTSAASAAELEGALNHLYPGAVPDWHAANGPLPPVTHFRGYTERQTGMYRITAMLPDAQAAVVIESCCDARFCLKRRLWTVPGCATDSVESTSIIPCLEPCSVFLEFARKAMRMEQEDRVTVQWGASELETMRGILEAALAAPEAGGREADFGCALNPRRVRLLLAKLKALDVSRPPDADH